MTSHAHDSKNFFPEVTPQALESTMDKEAIIVSAPAAYTQDMRLYQEARH
jgi:hypothetical protein